MAIKRITLSVPEEVVARVKRAAGTTPISAWVSQLIEQYLDEAELEERWREFVRDVAPTRDDSHRAEATLKRLMKPRRKRAA
jgi:hypothetical protein